MQKKLPFPVAFLDDRFATLSNFHGQKFLQRNGSQLFIALAKAESRGGNPADSA